jgi:hypothetical protein
MPVREQSSSVFTLPQTLFSSGTLRGISLALLGSHFLAPWKALLYPSLALGLRFDSP